MQQLDTSQSEGFSSNGASKESSDRPTVGRKIPVYDAQAATSYDEREGAF